MFTYNISGMTAYSRVRVRSSFELHRALIYHSIDLVRFPIVETYCFQCGKKFTRLQPRTAKSKL